MGTNEKRQAKRVSVSFKVDCQSEGHFLFERAANISEHGIFIQTEKPLPLGTQVKLQFSLAHDEAKISATGKVVWVSRAGKGKADDAPGMGVRFLTLSELDRETLLNNIKRLAVL